MQARRFAKPALGNDHWLWRLLVDTEPDKAPTDAARKAAGHPERRAAAGEGVSHARVLCHYKSRIVTDAGRMTLVSQILRFHLSGLQAFGALMSGRSPKWHRRMDFATDNP